MLRARPATIVTFVTVIPAIMAIIASVMAIPAVIASVIAIPAVIFAAPIVVPIPAVAVFLELFLFMTAVVPEVASVLVSAVMSVPSVAVVRQQLITRDAG
jgi:hypothetical protein